MCTRLDTGRGCGDCPVRFDRLMFVRFHFLGFFLFQLIRQFQGRLVGRLGHGLRFLPQVGEHFGSHGIPDDFKRRIFNRILKGTDKAKGMDFGLYIVKSLADSYGGRVWAEDRVPGDHTKGARFVVMLPVA